MRIIMLPQYTALLDQERQEVFRKLHHFANRFVLAGGTAIMMQIGHRQSFDFDCFSEKTLPENLVQHTKNIFGRSIYLQYKTSEQLTFKTNKGISITFVYHPYKLLRKPIKTPFISLFHLDDLATNKAYTIGRRAAWRDYVDLFFLLKRNLYNLEKVIKLTEKKFPNEFNEKLFLQQLVYFDDLDIIPMVFIKDKYSEKQIQSFLSQKVEEYLKQKLG